MAKRVSREERREIARLLKSGKTYYEIEAEIGRSHRAVWEVSRSFGGVVRGDAWNPSPVRLSLAEREEISLGLEAKETFTTIARRLGRAGSTVSREVNNNGGRDGYRPWRAHEAAAQRARRPKPSKLATCAKLRAIVEAWLDEWWSPQQIAARLRVEFPDDPEMRVSHETIYQSLFVQGRGALRRELVACLRTGRAKRQGPKRSSGRGQLRDTVSISERPAEVADRAVPGHWEGDLLIGKHNQSAIGTLVERTTRYVILLHLPEGARAEHVRDAMTTEIMRLPEHLRRSLTWDRGKEMAEHVQFSVDTGINVYFCDPYAPWQRGTNENTNGLLRQWFPKGSELSTHTHDDLDRVAAQLNNRPRQTLHWMKPSEKLAELIATTD